MIALSLFAVVVQFLAQSVRVHGQGTSAVCKAGFEWMTNSLGQNPCLVSSYLLTPCPSLASTFVFPLSPGLHYNTPTDSPSSATPCRCNTVLYSTISACAACQGQGLFVPLWSEYATNCSTAYISQYPEDIPHGTAVPAWAYLDVRKFDDFNAVAAEAVAEEDLPESTALSAGPTATGQTAAPSASGSGSGVGTPSGNNGNDTNSSSSKKSTNIAPIVGGVVGGVVGLIAIGLVIFFWLRHRRNAARDAPTGPVDLTAGEHGKYTDKSAGFGHHVPSLATAQYNQAVSSPPLSPKIYDPDDPSTFPDVSDTQAASTRDSATYVSPVQTHHMSAVPYAYPGAASYQPSPSANATAAYKGVPEL